MDVYVLCKWSGWVHLQGASLDWDVDDGVLTIAAGGGRRSVVIATFGPGCWHFVGYEIPDTYPT